MTCNQLVLLGMIYRGDLVCRGDNEENQFKPTIGTHDQDLKYLFRLGLIARALVDHKGYILQDENGPGWTTTTEGDKRYKILLASFK